MELNSEAALHAVSQGRGRAAGCANLTAAQTIAAQRCLRNSACSKALGHAGFCDNSKSATVLRHNPLAGLAAAAEQASNGSAGSFVRITFKWFLCRCHFEAVARRPDQAKEELVWDLQQSDFISLLSPIRGFNP